MNWEEFALRPTFLLSSRCLTDMLEEDLWLICIRFAWNVVILKHDMLHKKWAYVDKIQKHVSLSGKDQVYLIYVHNMPLLTFFQYLLFIKLLYSLRTEISHCNGFSCV